MLQLLYGNDRENIRTQFHLVREMLHTKYDNERVVREGETDDNFLAEVSSSAGLFGEKTLFIFDNILEKKEQQEIIVAHSEDLISSPNYFLLCEPQFEKDFAEDLEKAGAVTQEYAATKTNKRPPFNIFSLGDALGRRNKKELWVLYQEARDASLDSEEICGTLFWAVKNMALMKDAPVGVLCGLNPFVAKKNREFATNYTKEEIANLSHSLITLYHEAHNGGEPMDIALERFTLSI